MIFLLALKRDSPGPTGPTRQVHQPGEIHDGDDGGGSYDDGGGDAGDDDEHEDEDHYEIMFNHLWWFVIGKLLHCSLKP